MVAAGESILYLPVVVWAILGLGLIVAHRRVPPVWLLRLAAAFLGLWALLVTTTLAYVLAHGGWGAIVALARRPVLLFAWGSVDLWVDGALGAALVLVVAFGLNQLVGRSLVRLLSPRDLPWPRRLPRPATPTRLQRFASPRCEAFSFTLLARSSERPGGIGRLEVILLSDRLLDLLDPPEREAVIAHELGHLHALDSRYLTFLRTCARLVRWDPVVALLASSVTRQEEMRADGVAVELTGRPAALASALRKVAELEPTLPRPRALGFLGGARRQHLAQTEERVRRLLALSEAQAPGAM